MSAKLFPVTALAAMFAASAALAWPASNMLHVAGTPQDFTVEYRPSNIKGDYWCAAGDFIINKNRMSPTTRIWRTTDSSPRALGHMGFSVSSEGAASHMDLTKIGRDDASLTAAHAQSMCEGPRSIFPDD